MVARFYITVIFGLLDFKTILLLQTPIYIVTSLLMTHLEGRLIKAGNYEPITGDFSKQTGKIFYNSFAVIVAAWFLQYQRLVLMI